MVELFPVNETLINNSAPGFFRWVNSMTQGALGLVILIMIGMVSFLSTRNFEFEKSFAYSALFMALVAIPLRFLGLIDNPILGFTLILLIISVAVLFNNKEV